MDATSCVSTSTMSRPPNILWILTTQWRAQSLGCLEDADAHTPFLDAFAQESVLYRQAITPHPFGPFARAALLTGIQSPENGVRDYYDPLPRNSKTIAHALNDAGYDTAFIGKWHLSPRDRQAALVGETHARQIVSPEDRGGFSHWEGFESGFQLNNPWLQGPGDQPPYQIPGYQSDVLCERLAAWLETSARCDKPWFAVLSLEAPHPPYSAPAAGVAPSDPASLQLRPNVPRGGDLEHDTRRDLSGYHAHLTATDRALGKLLQHPILRHAALAFSSVHGDMHGSQGLFRKGWPYEESIRVPLLLRHPPDQARKPGISDELFTLLDLHAWTKHWAGLLSAPQAPAFQSCSMPSVVALPKQCDRTWSARRTASIKEVFTADGQTWLRFDLQADPFEQHNLV